MSSVQTLKTTDKERLAMDEKMSTPTPPVDSEVPELQRGAVDEFPEGGIQAWLTIFGVSFMMFITFGMIQAFGVFQDYYTRVLLNDFSPSTVSWIGSVQTCLLYAMGMQSGKWFDEGYFYYMISIGSIIYVVSMFMLSLCKPQQFYQFLLAQGFGMGIGMGLIAIPSISVISHYFKARRATANGIAFAGSSLGGVIWPIIFNRLIQGRVGFAWGVRIGAFICLGLVLGANLLMRTRLPPSPHVKRGYSGFGQLFKDLSFDFCLLGVFLAGFGLFFPFTYLQLFATLHGVPQDVTQYTLAILFASGTIFGRVLPGMLADRFGILNLMIIYTTIAGGLIFAMSRATNVASLVIFAIVYGPCGGLLPVLYPAVVGSYIRSVSEYGVRLGVGSILFGVAFLVGSPINGVLLRAPAYQWESAIIFSGVTALAGSAALVVSRHFLVKRKGRQTV